MPKDAFCLLFALLLCSACDCGGVAQDLRQPAISMNGDVPRVCERVFRASDGYEEIACYSRSDSAAGEFVPSVVASGVVADGVSTLRSVAVIGESVLFARRDHELGRQGIFVARASASGWSVRNIVTGEELGATLLAGRSAAQSRLVLTRVDRGEVQLAADVVFTSSGEFVLNEIPARHVPGSAHGMLGDITSSESGEVLYAVPGSGLVIWTARNSHWDGRVVPLQVAAAKVKAVRQGDELFVLVDDADAAAVLLRVDGHGEVTPMLELEPLAEDFCLAGAHDGLWALTVSNGVLLARFVDWQGQVLREQHVADFVESGLVCADNGANRGAAAFVRRQEPGAPGELGVVEYDGMQLRDRQTIVGSSTRLAPNSR